MQGLREAAELANWLGQHERAAAWSGRAAALAPRLWEQFRDDTGRLRHTLQTAGEPLGLPRLPDRGGHFRATYELGRRTGPSGPSRQANIRAALADVADADAHATILGLLLGADLPPIVTPYYRYSESRALARCGGGVPRRCGCRAWTVRSLGVAGCLGCGLRTVLGATALTRHF
ncbi:MAG: hypothetical protein AAF800_13595 [Planctomycetota bacterium]